MTAVETNNIVRYSFSVSSGSPSSFAQASCRRIQSVVLEELAGVAVALDRVGALSKREMREQWPDIVF